MPITIRPPEISFRVASALAVTVGSRVPGLVTQGPILMVRGVAAISVKLGYASCQSTCESKSHAYSKPWASASLVRSTHRLGGGSGAKQTPKLIRDITFSETPQTLASP